MNTPSQPTVSVVVTCYNLGEFIEETVESIAASSYANLEIVLVDDGSTDTATLTALERLEARADTLGRLRILRQQNTGHCGALNNGIRLATGNYLMPFGGDDRLRPDFLTEAVAILASEPELGVVYAYCQRFGLEDDLWEFPEVDEVRLLNDNCVPGSALFRRRVWEDCGGFDPLVVTHEDWEFWINAWKHGWKFRLLKKVGFEYRARVGSKVSLWYDDELRMKIVTHICEKHRGLYARHFPALLAEKHALESRLLVMLRERDERVVAFDRAVQERDETVRRQAEWIHGAEEKIEEVSASLQQHGAALRERTDYIEKLGAVYRAQEQASEETKRELNKAEEQLREIHGTRWWKLASWFAAWRK